MTNITTNDPGRTLPPKLAEFGESLLRIADRAREAQGLEPFGEDMHVFMRAVTSAFAGADDRGSVCVRLFDVARRMGLEVGEDEEAYDADIRVPLEELAGGLPLRAHPQRARAPWRPSCSAKAQAGLPPDFILRGSSPRSSALRLRSCGSPRSLRARFPR